jgi:3-demethoxyubiquinol 3-hydroxylase
MPTNNRAYSALDNIIIQFDRSVRAVMGQSTKGQRAYPADSSTPLTESQKSLSASLMRVNQAGEVCAQALYQGQALTARDTSVREKMQHAAEEETEHLAWCEQRLRELNSHVSYFNPFWYMGSLLLGTLAGLAGDRWSLAFLAETEHQVVKHLSEHLDRLPEHDDASRKIIQQMREDEAQHALTAEAAGAATLPPALKTMMAYAAKLMTTAAYHI